MNRTLRHLLLLMVAIAVIGSGVWMFLRYRALRLLHSSDVSNQTAPRDDAELWRQAVEKVKADRSATENTAVEIPPQLRHYEDRHWFLATQVAEVRKFNLPSCQDFVELAAMIQSGEMVVVPAVTGTYVLFGVGAKADDSAFSRYEDDHNIKVYDEAQLREAYDQLKASRSELVTEISGLQKQLSTLPKGSRTKQSELQKEIVARRQELLSKEDEKALLDRSYGQADSRQKLLNAFASLKALATNFDGHSFNLDQPADRLAMKVRMLSSLRPQALKILEEVAKQYHEKFDRPLPVSSLVRPEQYQHALNRVNRNAVLIDTPPHTTGLAFDIDYRYMSGAEQTFLMAVLAQMKDEGLIEVIRERNANYHVFAFVDGRRPADDLITASLDAATLDKEANHAAPKPVKAESKSRNDKKKKAPSRANRRRH